MARKILQEKIVTNAEAQEILGKVKEEELGEFQRRTLDYARKFSKITPDKADKLVEELSSKLQLDRNDAIQIVNSLPKTIEELREFPRVIKSPTLELPQFLLLDFSQDLLGLC